MRCPENCPLESNPWKTARLPLPSQKKKCLLRKTRPERVAPKRTSRGKLPSNNQRPGKLLSGLLLPKKTLPYN